MSLLILTASSLVQCRCQCHKRKKASFCLPQGMLTVRSEVLQFEAPKRNKNLVDCKVVNRQQNTIQKLVLEVPSVISFPHIANKRLNLCTFFALANSWQVSREREIVSQRHFISLPKVGRSFLPTLLCTLQQQHRSVNQFS